MNPKTLYLISYGLYIVASRKGDRRNGQVANAVVQVTSEPPRLAIGINKGNLTHEFIADSGVFTVSILRQETPLGFIGGFGFRSGRDADKLADVAYRVGETGAPVVLDNALGYLEALVVGQADAGTHTIFIGDIVAAEVVADGAPMTYAYYQQVKRGSTPKSAPSYVAAAATTARRVESSTERTPYVCTVCGYVYDPAVGDPDGGIPAGTPFAALPDDWVCPVCGAAKSQFEPA